MVYAEGMAGELRDVLHRSFRKSLWVSWTILVVMVPISLAVTILQYTGVLERIAWVLSPFMKIVSLPPEASLALIAGALINIYAGIAVMGTLGLDAWSINIIAVMMLICHNLVVESAVQSKTGVSGLKMTTFRIIAAFGMGICLSFILPVGLKHGGPGMGAVVSSARHGLNDVFILWFSQTSALTLKVIFIIALINLIIDVMRFFKAFDPVISLLRPLTFINGLPEKTSFMWMAGIFFGLAYGSGVLIAEARTGNVDKDSLVRLNLSLGISHSLIEDTFLFVAIGASLFWVLIPRMVAAAIMVWIYILVSPFFRQSQQG
jgi:hypothetical protein